MLTHVSVIVLTCNRLLNYVYLMVDDWEGFADKINAWVYSVKLLYASLCI